MTLPEGRSHVIFIFVDICTWLTVGVQSMTVGQNGRNNSLPGQNDAICLATEEFHFFRLAHSISYK